MKGRLIDQIESAEGTEQSVRSYHHCDKRTCRRCCQWRREWGSHARPFLKCDKSDACAGVQSACPHVLLKCYLCLWTLVSPVCSSMWLMGATVFIVGAVLSETPAALHVECNLSVSIHWKCLRASPRRWTYFSKSETLFVEPETATVSLQQSHQTPFTEMLILALENALNSNWTQTK